VDLGALALLVNNVCTQEKAHCECRERHGAHVFDKRLDDITASVTMQVFGGIHGFELLL